MLTMRDKIKAIWPEADVQFVNGCAVYDGHEFRRNGEGVVEAWTLLVDPQPWEEPVPDSGYSATIIGKIQDLFDGTTLYLTGDEQALLAEAEAADSFGYDDLFDEIVATAPNCVKEWMCRRMKQDYVGNAAWAETWHAKAQAAGLPALFAKLNG